jgi:hypothetical protein
MERGRECPLTGAGVWIHGWSTQSIDRVLNLKNEKFKAKKITVLTTQKYV